MIPCMKKHKHNKPSQSVRIQNELQGSATESPLHTRYYDEVKYGTTKLQQADRTRAHRITRSDLYVIWGRHLE